MEAVGTGDLREALVRLDRPDGRLARQLVPFFCLITADAIERMRTSPHQRVRMLMPAVVAVVLGQAAVNFWVPLRQSFPSEFLERASRDAGDGDENPEVMGINTRHIYPAPEPASVPPRYVVLKEARHPLQFLPYQYEGYTAAERQALRSTDIRMRAIVAVPE